MAVKETIAFIGEPTQEFTLLARHLGNKNYQLLIVTEGDPSVEYAEQRLQAEFPATVESIDCVKDGCWEADVVILLEAKTLEKGLLDKIREVATQKIVVYLMANKEGCRPTDGNPLQQVQNLLPNSKVVGLLYESVYDKLMLSGNDNEAIAFIATLVEDLANTTIEHSQQ